MNAVEVNAGNYSFDVKRDFLIAALRLFDCPLCKTFDTFGCEVSNCRVGWISNTILKMKESKQGFSFNTVIELSEKSWLAFTGSSQNLENLSPVLKIDLFFVSIKTSGMNKMINNVLHKVLTALI